MHQTAHHRRNRAFYPLVNEGILGKLFSNAFIFAIFLHCPYFRGSHQNRVVGLVLCFELAVQRRLFHVLVVIGLNRTYQSMAQGELGNTKFDRLSRRYSVFLLAQLDEFFDVVFIVRNPLIVDQVSEPFSFVKAAQVLEVDHVRAVNAEKTQVIQLILEKAQWFAHAPAFA